MSKPKRMSEAAFIADQLRRAFSGPAWHGPALLKILKDVDADTAASKPISNAHSIWELVLHIEVWDRAGLVRLTGKTFRPSALANFPPVSEPSEEGWHNAVEIVKRTHDSLLKTVAKLPDARLLDRVPGKTYNFHHMLHGIAQHELYHAGQIAILKKALIKAK